MIKPRLFYFNPDNDVALGRGVENYTPPGAAMRLRVAGQLLPLWTGDAGDMVWCTGVDREWYHRMIDTFGLEARVFDHNYRHGLQMMPWGWSAAARKDFINDGCPEALLPSPAAIERLRLLSHRRTAAQLAMDLREIMPDARFTDPAVEVCSIDGVRDMMQRWGNVVVKMPWSSSGRGVVGTSRGMAEAMKVATDSIRLQGSVMIEPEHDKVFDFAKIYQCSGGECRCLGTSVFATDAHNRYTRNMLACEADRRAEVAKYTDLEHVDRVSEVLKRLIEERIAPCYDGIVGVDMLACADGTLDPVVEVNLRCTMGYVAGAIADRYLADGSVGTFEVVPLRGSRPVSDVVIENGKFVRGRFFLTPSLHDFGFCVIVEDHPCQ